MLALFWIIFALAALTLVGYVIVWLSPERRRLFLPTDQTERAGALPVYWPGAAIAVPARNEAESLVNTLPSWLEQDYPNLKKIVIVDDRSEDGTGQVARQLAQENGATGLVEVLENAPLPKEWSGKVWALHNAIRHLLKDPSIEYILLTDADIAHKPDSLSRLVRQSLDKGLGFNSRMARLRCVSFAEKWLIPPFLYFFLLLYPLRRANNPEKKTASGAGGCILLSREAIERLGGGLEPIRGCVIDDVNLAKAVKDRGLGTHLSLSVSTVVSTRPYPHVGDIAKMVRRSAYCQLNYNPLLLGLALGVMAVVFILPTCAVLLGVFGMGHPHAFTGAEKSLWLWSAFLADVGAAALALQLAHFKQALDFYGLSPWRIFAFPAAGLAYAWMTLQSAWRHWRGQALPWREKS